MTGPNARDIELLDSISHGFTDRQVARRLDMSDKAVKMAIHRAKIKLGANSRVHAVAIAMRKGLIP